MKRALVRISHEIIEKNKGTDNLILVGVKRRGIPLAREISNIICRYENVRIPVGELDITLYRDDLEENYSSPKLNSKSIDFNINEKTVVIVDDVIYTGRTSRAAMDALIDMGRPKCIRLAVLIDRGHRELPIRADFVGKNVPTSKKEIISVEMPPYDKYTQVLLKKQSV